MDLLSNHNDDEQEASLNPYLALRAAKIARNQARLKELGLLKYEPPPLRQAQNSNATGRTKKAANNDASGNVATVPIRRSQRLQQDEGNQEPTSKRQKISDEMLTDSTEQQSSTTKAKIRSSPKPATIAKPLHPKSVRNISIHVSDLVLGNSKFPNGILGQRLMLPGKAHCMEISAERSGADFYHGLSFNKYSGIQEWKNDALFLWVNLDGSNEVVNEFLEGGRKMTWYGGSRHHDESSIILRLLQVGQQAAQGKVPLDNGIILWCRQYDAAKRTWLPYTCLGRLAYHSHEQGSRPLRFVMSLIDFDRLNQHADLTVRKAFQDIVAAS